MTNFENIPDDIKEGIILFNEGALTEDMANKLYLWMQESKENMLFFEDVTHIWNVPLTHETADGDRIQKAWTDVIHRMDENPELDKNVGGSLWIKPLLRIAATIAVFMILGNIWLYQTLKSKEAFNSGKWMEYTVPLGSKSTLTLSDGTKIWLNSGSHLKVPANFGEKTRDVLLEGECYFAVAKDKTKPFIIHTSDINITALGTAFNVKAYSDEQNIETTLEEGSVKIESNQMEAEKMKPLILMPNQTAIFQRSNQRTIVSATKAIKTNECTRVTHERTEERIQPIRIVQVEDTRPIVSWKDQRWFIKQEYFKDLVRKIERRYDVNIIIQDEAIKNFSFTGSLQDESIEQVLHIIQLTAPIDYSISHKTVTLRMNYKQKGKFKEILQP